MMFDKIIAERRSIRKYKDNPVTQEQISAILEAGNKAPSAKNKQHWRFHVFRKKAKDDLTTFCLAEFDKIAKEPGVSKYARNSFQIMQEAPVVVLILISDIMEHPLRPDIQSVSAAIQNMLLKAQQLGLGSLWICDVLYIDQQIMKYLKTDMPLVAAVTFGYANENPSSRAKLTVEDVTTWHE